MEETRKSNRVPKRLEATLLLSGHSFPIVIKNISLTGICASIRANIPLGTRCTICIPLGKELVLEGTVARCKNNEVGIAFYNLTTQQKEVLASLQ